MAYDKKARKEYREKNRERILAYERKWYREHPEKGKEYESHRNKEQRDKWQKEYKAKHKEHFRECARLSALRRNAKARLEIINRLGGKCVKCGFSDIRALHIHHKFGGGNIERKFYGNGTAVTNYRYHQGLLEHLEDLELLCANCHAIVSWDKKHIKNIPK